MEDKYYAPEISEFYEGFEVEVNHRIRNGSGERSWCKEKFRMSEENIRFTKYLLENEPENIRVKHLDKEDIKELGFTFIKQGDFYSKDTLIFERKVEEGINTGVIYTLTFRPETPTIVNIVYSTYSSYDNEKGNFRLTINNKSEARKAFRQLGIIK